ncbi:Gfo/Idh/MocA family oxidoreductase [Panacibacter ginsenosidivorans]|uniref:Gfo/Idh/MocA family oxidoreductase n=1 Tax=Panacibacter ginsenosidivorans TaxID=1813871 RepID=A0A5B8VCX1_9BACT|nr:Gfo/Idh/MocA family oxidoreductase [Panacibacter ginsenosidivorans]QEC69162.1 Gfo/Idh/MocA family oxidoreductase [Panacibacter ginsenosidivorans]
MKKNILKHSILLICFIVSIYFSNAQSTAPVRICVARITHDHVGWILSRNKPDVTIAGIYEPDKELAERYAKKYSLNEALFYTDLNKMLDALKPEAVVAFGSIYEHMQVVEACAPRHIHVMVEKPLATTYQQALRMDTLAKKFNIKLLTNFETSWYPSTAKTYNLINDSNYIGNIKKVVIHDGHQGPKEIGVSKNFFEWLTDPVQNGGGALIDFGCYGANLMTYLMHGQQPVSVTAVTQHFKPDIYPKVDDEATIIVTYPTAQCIIQASWNWPFGRKDMEVYGDKGYIISTNNTNMRLRSQPDSVEHSEEVNATDLNVYTDPFAYLANVLRNKITVPENGLYALNTNITVVRILDAAGASAKTGKTIYFKK